MDSASVTDAGAKYSNAAGFTFRLQAVLSF